MSPVVEEEAPPYVHRLLDAFLRHSTPEDDSEMPADIRARIQEYQQARAALAAERDVDFTDSHMLLISRVAYAVSAEFERSLGIQLGASRDDTWLKAGDGIVARTGLQHVGWYHEEGERAHMFVRADLYPTPPDDGRDWHPAYAIA